MLCNEWKVQIVIFVVAVVIISRNLKTEGETLQEMDSKLQETGSIINQRYIEL